jgi:nucleoside-diphosphate-sugar epimerase
MTGKLVIAGALGLTGRAVLEYFETCGDWDIVALSRRSPNFSTRATFIKVDLADAQNVRDALGHLNDVTHIVYAVLSETDAVAANLAMLRNLMDVVEPTNPKLAHISLLQGGKAYGAHLGQMKLPGKESDPRHMPPNFYYSQEDLLRTRQAGKQWFWTVFRPMALVGSSLGSPMNILNAIGVYAAICRELDVPFSFTGAQHAQIGQLTDVRLLARAIAWAGTCAAAQNQIFNVTNGDMVVWQNIWPCLARRLGVEPAPPRPMPLSVMMADKAPVWDRAVLRHGLIPHQYDDLVGASWQFADSLFGYGMPANVALLSSVKIRKAGFGDCIDSEDMFDEWIDRLQGERVLPTRAV